MTENDPVEFDETDDPAPVVVPTVQPEQAADDGAAEADLNIEGVEGL